ncbi:hypothetical protein L7F22_020188 [Adiantum nelumboides]|nr:hypothetical protein [Adiantum nelumboides]
MAGALTLLESGADHDCLFRGCGQTIGTNVGGTDAAGEWTWRCCGGRRAAQRGAGRRPQSQGETAVETSACWQWNAMRRGWRYDRMQGESEISLSLSLSLSSAAGAATRAVVQTMQGLRLLGGLSISVGTRTGRTDVSVSSGP